MIQDREQWKADGNDRESEGKGNGNGCESDNPIENDEKLIPTPPTHSMHKDL